MPLKMKTGRLRGTGAAINVSLGFLPSVVEVVNITDGDKITRYYADVSIAFTSGGTTEITAGQTITGATSGATAVVDSVILGSGSWAGGDAAGFFICKEADVTGTFQSENVNVGSASNLATVAAQVQACVDIDTEVASASGNTGIAAYQGTTSAGKGFTIGSTVSESGKLLAYVAYGEA